MDGLSYCWGDRHTPARILSEADAAVVVEVEGAPRTIPLSKIVGRVSDGDRLQVLVSGGAWLWGQAQVDEAGLWVVLGSGRRWVLSDARLIRVVPKQLSLFAAPIISSDHSDNSVNSVSLINGVGQKPITKTRPTLCFDIPFDTRQAACKGCDAEISVGTLVRHQKYWQNHIGVVKDISRGRQQDRGAIASLWFRDGVPLYHCSVELLCVVE
jgi:hypothetical protein